MANAAGRIGYEVQFAPATHYASIEASFPAGAGALELFLPVWTPGSYLVREYARNIEDLTAEDLTATGAGGEALTIVKTRKNRWRIETRGAASVVVRYRVYCREMTVRTNWVDEDFALLNGAATFLAPVDGLANEFHVHLKLPPQWKMSISGMDETAPNTFTAPDYDTLVDCPILAGSPTVHEFEVAGKKHYLVNEGETPLWDGVRAARDTQRIVEENLKLWGALPFSKYVFLNLIVEGGGGLEHKSSMTIMSSRYATRTRKSYLGWLGLVSHEYFHAWNVKRLRPVELGPFDYENEVYTHNLWMAEGFTDYYAGLNVRRAGLATDSEFLGVGNAPEIWRNSLSAQIEALQTTPGRLAQPVEMASYDAWIKAYRPDENSINTSISYYVKGAVVAWLVDARLRHVTQGHQSLDDLMKVAYSRYSGARGYTTEQILDLAGEIGGADSRTWFKNLLETTQELGYSEALSWFGLQFKTSPPPTSDNRAKAWTGFDSKPANSRLIISQIRRGTPAEQAGLSVDDEILAVDDWRITPEGWSQRLEQYAPGDTIVLLVSRRDHVIRVPLKLGAEPARAWQIQIAPGATQEQKSNYAAWVNGPSSASAPAR